MVNEDLDLSSRFWNNISAILTHKGHSARWLAHQIGVSPAAISKYARGTIPNLSVAAKIATVLGVSLDLLLTATPEEVLSAVDSPGGSGSPVERHMRERRAGWRLADELGLGRVALLRERAPMTGDYRVIKLLVGRVSAGMTQAELSRELSDDDNPSEQVDVGTSLTSLMAQGYVQEIPGSPPSYRATSQVLQFNLQEVGDTARHVVEMIRCLTRDILPLIQRQPENARLLLSTYRVRPERIRELARREVQLLRELRLGYDAGDEGQEFVELHAFALPNLANH